MINKISLFLLTIVSSIFMSHVIPVFGMGQYLSGSEQQGLFHIKITNQMFTSDVFPKFSLYLSAHASHIHSVDLSYSAVNDEQLTAICAICSEIYELNLEFCSGLHEFNFGTLIKLKNLNLNYTSVTQQQVLAIKQQFPGVIISREYIKFGLI
ncbi:MAG: hypothetical protein V1646_01845 [bacterium]